MPVGLDGHPDPIVTRERSAALRRVAERIGAHLRSASRVLVGVDGRSGVGKSTFADEIATTLAGFGISTVRSTTDSFHRSRRDRMRLGPTSAEGYYADSHQLGVIVEELLEPFRRGSSSVLVAAFDEPSDSIDRRTSIVVDEPTVLVFDGLFILRPELAPFWHETVYLTADARLDRRWVDYLLGDLPDDAVESARMLDERLHRARWPRYRDGWARYVEAVDPAANATVVIDNDDLANPAIVRASAR